MKAYLKDYNSPAFPVAIIWKNGKQTNVFETAEQAKAYIIGRYGKVQIIDRREKER